ncbi:MAG: hypothetical protein CL885_02695 [Dehalococcoidia bacterium]|nr:hypothetical protein [Dehalococcoidia bacterium]
MPDYLKNPLFNDQILHFDGAVPGINFQYKWDTEENQWVPHTGEAVNIGDITIGDIDLSDEQTHTLLGTLITSADGVEASLTSLEDLSTQNKTHLEAIKSATDNLKTSNSEKLTTIIGLAGDNKTFLSQIDQSTTEALNKLTDVNTGLGSLLSKNTEILAKDTEILAKNTEILAKNDEILTSSNNLETLTLQSNSLLSELKDSIDDLDLEIGDVSEDKEAHRILSGISGQDKDHQEENERLLRHIRNNTCNQTLALEEIKKNYRDLTYHIKKFEEDHLALEASDFTDPTEQTFKSKIFKQSLKNGRLTDPKSPEKNQYAVMGENFPTDKNERDYVFDEGMPFSIRMESFLGGEGGWHSLFPFDKKLGSDDKVTVYNESIFPLQVMFRGGDQFTLNEGISMELTKEEAMQLYVKRDYTISGFEVRYSIERMYTPEENVTIGAGEPDFLKPEQTHARIGLGKVITDKNYLYIAHGRVWKRAPLANWEHAESKTPVSFSIDYFDAYASNDYLYLNTVGGKRRLPISEWDTQSDRPTECYSEVWADNNFIYCRYTGPVGPATHSKGNIVMSNYLLLEGATVTIGDRTVTEGTDWNKSDNNENAAKSLAEAINNLEEFKATSFKENVNITSSDAGASGNVAISTSKPDIILAPPTLTGGEEAKMEWKRYPISEY